MQNGGFSTFGFQNHNNIWPYIFVGKDGRLRSVPTPIPTPAPGQWLDSDSGSDSSIQKNVDSDSGSDSSCQKKVDSDSDSDSSQSKHLKYHRYWIQSPLCMHDFPHFPHISQSVSTFFANTESCIECNASHTECNHSKCTVTHLRHSACRHVGEGRAKCHKDRTNAKQLRILAMHGPKMSTSQTFCSISLIYKSWEILLVTQREPTLRNE